MSGIPPPNVPPKDCVIGDGVEIARDARINVTERLVIGDRTVINSGAIIEGRRVELGRECWLAENAHIGGGSCFDDWSVFKCGDWLHMGRYSHVNTARSVVMGDEVGLGRGTCVYTHGAYLSAWEGFPANFDSVVIGSRVWIPQAIVLPGVRLGDDIVVAAGSVVTKDFPSGCMIRGVPAVRLRDNLFPDMSGNSQSRKRDIIFAIETDIGVDLKYDPSTEVIVAGDTVFKLKKPRTIEGPATNVTERVKNQLRRYGIRFRFTARAGEYVKW